MRNRLVISESEKNEILKKYNLLIEQSSIYNGSTDGDTVSHKKLNIERGLPYTGEKDENMVYQTGIQTVLTSWQLPKNEKLSIFKAIGGSFSEYTDYISFIGQDEKGKELTPVTLKGPGTQKFNLAGNGKILASHNGLLAIARVMDQLKGNYPGPVTITFGTEKGKTKKADDQRFGEGITFDSQTVTNQNIPLRGIVEAIVLLSINPKYREFTSSSYRNFNDEELEKFLKTSIFNLSRGDSGFLISNSSRKSEIIKTAGLDGLTYDVSSIVSTAKEYAKIPDSTNNIYDVSNDRKSGKLRLIGYDQSKGKKLNDFGSSIMPNLVKEIKSTYLSNLQKFINVYLKDNPPNITDVTMEPQGFQYYQQFLFTSQPVSEVPFNIDLESTAQTYKKGQ